MVKKLKFFAQVLTKSITKLSYYKEIVKTKLSFSLKYLFFLFYLISFITSLVFVVLVATTLLPKVPSFVANFDKNANSLYPAGLVVNVKDGIVSTNQKEPYNIDNFITIDTKADASKIKDTGTAFLVIKDSIVMHDKDNTYRVYPIDPSTNLTIDKNAYSKIISQILPYLKYLQPGLIILLILSVLIWPILASALIFVYELIYLLIWSVPLFLISKIMKKKLSFGKVYQLTIHAATLPIVLGFIVSSLNFQMPFLLGTAILVIFMILVLNQF